MMPLHYAVQKSSSFYVQDNSPYRNRGAISGGERIAMSAKFPYGKFCTILQAIAPVRQDTLNDFTRARFS